MDQLQQFIRRSRTYAYLLIILSNILALATWWAVDTYLGVESFFAPLAALLVAVIVSLFVVWVISSLFMQPLTFVWRAILYIAPQGSAVAAPDLTKARYGKELVANLVNHVYQLADISQNVAQATVKEQDTSSAQFIANMLPLPLVILDENQNVLFANRSIQKYIRNAPSDITDHNIYSLLDLSFQSENTLDAWLKRAKAKAVTATKTWRKVRLTMPDAKDGPALFDLTAYYNKSNPAGYEAMLVFFDQTEVYSQDDRAVDFVSLAVHELRTPLTMLRGYIEVIEEELEDTASDELKGFLQKTQAAAGQLSTFVNNILNVSRIEDNQMLLKLEEENWQNVLSAALDELSLRAKVRGITITRIIADDPPTVGIDRVSIYEVLSNLIDNAIKYSSTSKEIIVSAKLNSEGLIETTVQDLGVGIPQSAMARLFTKFYRDHRNKGQVNGTGLGLYLCKTIINAHEGNIWVRSKEGEGSTFGFALMPYNKLAEELKNNDNKNITRNAHGWIKNHSLYRR